jgi:hypothetical protein
MPDEYPTLTLIEEEGHTNERAESSRKRIAAAFDAVRQMAEDADQFDDLLYGPGGGPPPPPPSEPVSVGDRPPSFRVTP